MDTANLIHADIFFFITSIAVVLCTILLIFILVYVLRTIRAVTHIVEKIKIESEQVIDDLSDLREKIKDSGSNISGMGKWLLTLVFGKVASGVFTASKKKKKAKGTNRDATEEGE